jgi:hypothetical protein
MIFSNTSISVSKTDKLFWKNRVASPEIHHLEDHNVYRNRTRKEISLRL